MILSGGARHISSDSSKPIEIKAWVFVELRYKKTISNGRSVFLANGSTETLLNAKQSGTEFLFVHLFTKNQNTGFASCTCSKVNNLNFTLEDSKDFK